MRPDPGSLADRLKPGPLDDEAGTGRAALDRLMSALDRSGGVPDLLRKHSELSQRRFRRFFFSARPCRASASTPESRTQRRPRNERFAEILSGAAGEAAAATTQRELMSILRQAKNEVAFLIALADLGDVWTVDEVTRKLSEAADLFLSLALRFLLTKAARAGQFLPRTLQLPRSTAALSCLGWASTGRTSSITQAISI